MSMKYNIPIENIAVRLNGVNIPAVTKEIEGGSALIVQLPSGEKIDAICSSSSWGGSRGLLEIKGAVTEAESICGDIFGGLTENEVFKRFKYCYENNTRVYRRQ